MTSLSEKDKKRIEEEERYREQVRNGLGKEKEEKPKRGKGCLTVILIIFALIVIGGIMSASTNKTSTTPAKTDEQIRQDEKAKQDKINALGQTFCSERKSGVRAVNLATFIEMYNKKGETVTLKPASGAPSQENCNKVAEICITIWNEEECQNIAERKIWIGMTEDQLILSWGLANDRNNSAYSFGINSQWVYGSPIYGANYVYLEGKTEEDMKVTSWQD